MGFGAAIGAYSGYKSAKNANKAQKQIMKMLQEGLKQYKAGSLDAYGNKLSADKNGLWSYNLTNSVKDARSGANKAMSALGNYNPKSRSDYLSEGLYSLYSANKRVADSNQASAMKNALRQGSNLGYISNSYAQNNSNNLKKAYAQAFNNASNWQNNNANTLNNLANNASNAMRPIQNIQSNLQNMVNNLNRTVMNQYNNMAGAIRPKQDTLSSALVGGYNGNTADLNNITKALSLGQSQTSGEIKNNVQNSLMNSALTNNSSNIDTETLLKLLALLG